MSLPERLINDEELDEGVSIIVFTFEHDEYIEQCIESILNQKTNFPVYIVIYVDFSENKTTLEIAKEFQKKYPNNIIVFENHKRLYNAVLGMISHKFLIRTKFWGILEGDDYYSSEYKLKKQVGVLQNNPKAVGTCSKYQVLTPKGLSKPQGPDYKSFNTFGKRKNRNKYLGYAHPSSVLWRNFVEFENTPFPKSFFKLRGDVGLEIAMLGAFSTMICTNEAMSVYRITGKGIWTSLSLAERDKRNKEAEIRWAKFLDLRIKVSLILSSNPVTFIFYIFLSSIGIIPKEIAER